MHRDAALPGPPPAGRLTGLFAAPVAGFVTALHNLQGAVTEKLDIDFAFRPLLGVGRECGMEEQRRTELLRRLFHLITVEAEELAGLAVGGQGIDASGETGRELALKALDLGGKIVIIAEATAALC